MPIICGCMWIVTNSASMKSYYNNNKTNNNQYSWSFTSNMALNSVFWPLLNLDQSYSSPCSNWAPRNQFLGQKWTQEPFSLCRLLTYTGGSSWLGPRTLWGRPGVQLGCSNQTAWWRVWNSNSGIHLCGPILYLDVLIESIHFHIVMSTIHV